MPLERNRLLKVKRLEVPVPVALFKATQRLRSGIHRWLTVPFGFLEIGEVFALDSLVFRAVFPHGCSPLPEVTVYGGRITLVYLSPCLHNRDVQFRPNQGQLFKARAPEDHPFAVRTNAHQVPKCCCNRLVLRHVSGGFLRSAASHAIDFSWLAGPLVFRPPRLEIPGQLTAKNQNGALAVARW